MMKYFTVYSIHPRPFRSSAILTYKRFLQHAQNTDKFNYPQCKKQTVCTFIQKTWNHFLLNSISKEYHLLERTWCSLLSFDQRCNVFWPNNRSKYMFIEQTPYLFFPWGGKSNFFVKKCAVYCRFFVIRSYLVYVPPSINRRTL